MKEQSTYQEIKPKTELKDFPRWREGFSRAKEKLINGTRHSLAPAGDIK